MSWNEVLNNSQYPWIKKSVDVVTCDKDNLQPKDELHRTIFDVSKHDFLKYISFITSFCEFSKKRVLGIGTGNGNLLLGLQSKYLIRPYGA